LAGLLTALLQPLLLGQALDAIISCSLSQAYTLLGAMAVTLGVQGLLGLGETYFTAKAAGAILWAVREKLYGHVLASPTTAFDRTRHGDFLSRIDGDAGAIASLVVRRAQLLPDAIRCVAVLFVISHLSLVLTAIQITVTPLLFVIAGWFGVRSRQAAGVYRGQIDEYISQVQESVSGHREVKSLTLQQFLARRFREHGGRILASSLRLSLINANAGLAGTVLSGFGSAAVIAFAAVQIAQGRFSVGRLVSFTSYAEMLAGFLRNLMRFRQTAQEQSASLERVFHLMDSAAELPCGRSGGTQSACAEERRPSASTIALHSVTFGYDTSRSILKDITCEFPPGVLTGIAGQSGSGKTTLLSLIMRFYEPQHGVITLDGEDISHMDLTALRTRVAIVSQDSYFFRASVRENLLLARRDASVTAIGEACALSGALGFIESLPNGYETVLSDKGASLSGGQRQRLALARAVLRGSSILMCDEPVSALDSEGEVALLAALRHLATGRTIAIVAHRPSTIARCDRILLIHRGRLVAQGAHGELAANSALYRRLMGIDMRGGIVDPSGRTATR
jgi:ABC-type multidrug transport system fused ATPase/permease subunit